MNIHVYRTSDEMGAAAAKLIAGELNAAVEEKGEARLLLSTGASQFEMFQALVKETVDWSRVTMFHLDEYVGLEETHKASFRKYLKERFVSKVKIREAVFVDGEGDVNAQIRYLSERLREAPIDVGVVGIGENGHIAFNDPPADFTTQESYIVVNLDEKCKLQQVGEGWFATADDVPKQAVSMTVHQIMKCRKIISVVPHKEKAAAVFNTLSQPVTAAVPATILKTHGCWDLFLDAESSSGFLNM